MKHPEANAETRTLLAAQGYFELGMLDDASNELDSLPASMHDRMEVLQMRLFIHMRARRWEQALDIGRALCRTCPDDALGYIHAAFCLHELGQTAEAKKLLLAGPPTLRDEATYHYNLGCYDVALGNIADAQAHLRASFRLDKKFREFARTDPDLESVRNML